MPKKVLKSMGIPSFFRWLIKKYPLAVVHVPEDDAATIDGVVVLPDATKPNPIGFEFDNLYLDMNGVHAVPLTEHSDIFACVRSFTPLAIQKGRLDKFLNLSSEVINMFLGAHHRRRPHDRSRDSIH